MTASPALRILFTFAGGSGHLEPLLPLAAAARAAGHVSLFVGRPWMVERVREHDFDVVSIGSDDGLEPVTRPLLEVDPERELEDLRQGFVRRLGGQRATDLVPIIEGWHPDLVVWEETDFGAGVAAERTGVPHAVVQVTAVGSFVHPGTVGDALETLRADHGLPADPAAAMLSRYLYLTPVPPAFRDPAVPPAPTLHTVRLHDPGRLAAGPDRPDWARRIPDAPAVYATLGTIFNHESGDLFQRTLAALADMRINALLTVGRELDPADLGPQPDHITIERFVPQATVLPAVDGVIAHGGSGSVLGALAHGLPLVLLPMGADQPWNARRCEAVGAGIVLDVMTVSADEIRGAVEMVLQDVSYRTAARELASAMAAMPPPSAAIDLLERVARDRAPLIG